MRQRRPSSRISLSTVFPLMESPCSALRAIATWRYPMPLGARANASRTKGRTSAHLSALGGAPPSRVAVVGALGELKLVEHELERVFAPQRVRRLRSISSAKALIRFWISSSSSSSRTRASSSSSREENAGSGFLGRPLGLGRRASGPPSR